MNNSWTEAEVKRWLWLRSVEWAALPAFIAQPIAPILIIFFPWYQVLASVVIIGIAWCAVRCFFVSVTIATFACLAVSWLKWPAAIGSSIYLFYQHEIVSAIVALLWPLFGGLIGIPGKAGAIELAFAKKIGFVSEDAQI